CRSCPPLKELTWCIGPPLKNSLARLLNTDDEDFAQEALALYRERFAKAGLYENAVYPGIPAVLKELSTAGHMLYLATAKPTLYAGRIINHFNLQAYFRKLYGSELDGTRTDKSELIAYILQKEKTDSSQTVMIGDRKHDMIGAKNNGVTSVGVLWGYGGSEELKACRPDILIKRPADLPTAISRMKKR
ncbi:MAG: HAD hydrolase-like protein, partial [Chlorobiales bacterium]|nr:HAD hydrolase-like protein [Chlorobiales bacterium]